MGARAAAAPPAADTEAAWKAPAAMVLVQLFQTGQILLSKVVMGHGMFAFALVAYRSALGAAFLLPLALICERCSSSSPSPAARLGVLIGDP